MMDISEQQFYERLQSGDAMAQKALYAKYVGSLTAVCSRYVADADDVKDVMQEVFIKVFTQIASFTFRGEGSLKAWLMRITVNTSLTYLKNAGRLSVVRDDTQVADIVEDEEPDAEGVPPDELQRMIMRLPDGYRTVLNLYVFEDKSHKEIAALLNIKPTSSASQLFHAKALMAKMIVEYKRTH
ncbi:RNA polymerase sigma factor [uncultured Prevotella sp.]|uniref:RNA polymerase sigma factor n=1 Tax=uncultured Prevotella sp. TaxID=159272 RepID=UPI00338F9B47